MAEERDAERGSGLLSRISNEMVKAQKEFWGKGPEAAKSYMFDDMLFIVMHGGLTAAEKTMLDFGHQDLVRQFRQTFENEMTERLSDMIGELTGRKVLTYQSQILFDPDRVVELFIFDDDANESARAATAEGQLSEGEAGEATVEEDLDQASGSGR